MKNRSQNRSPSRAGRFACAAAALVLLGTWSADASAGCMRRIYNRSTYVLVASRDGGPPVTLLPGRSVQIRLEHPGRIDLAAYCGIPGEGAAGAPIAQTSFAYEAVLDRCFIRFGNQFLTREFGRGMFGTQGTAPFTVNNPNQGDVILGPFEAACPFVSRSG